MLLANAPAQYLHQIDVVAGGGLRHRRDRLTGAFLVDEVDHCDFILALELLGLEPSRLLVHECLRDRA